MYNGNDVSVRECAEMIHYWVISAQVSHCIKEWTIKWVFDQLIAIGIKIYRSLCRKNTDWRMGATPI